MMTIVPCWSPPSTGRPGQSQTGISRNSIRPTPIRAKRKSTVCATETSTRPRRPWKRLLPQAVIAADDSTRALVATASKADHLRIETAVQQLDVAREDPTETRVYNFQLGDVEAAQTVLQSLLPDAVFAVDPDNKLLVATAYPAEEHERIQVTVKELDRPNAEQPSLQAYRITKANFQSVYEALDDMFRRDPEVRISADPENQTILVKAPAGGTSHDRPDRLANGKLVPTRGLRRRLVVYPLKGEADNSLLTALQDLFANQQPAVELSLDTASDQVLAVATDKQHELIRGAIEQMQGAETIVRSLSAADDGSVLRRTGHRSAVCRRNRSARRQRRQRNSTARGPRNAQAAGRNPTTAAKMGELPAVGTQTTKGLRVIPFRGDVQDAVEQIQRSGPDCATIHCALSNPRACMSPLMPLPPQEGITLPPAGFGTCSRQITADVATSACRGN